MHIFFIFVNPVTYSYACMHAYVVTYTNGVLNICTVVYVLPDLCGIWQTVHDWFEDTNFNFVVTVVLSVAFTYV